MVLSSLKRLVESPPSDFPSIASVMAYDEQIADDIELDVELGDGRTLQAYDTGANGVADHLAVFWHHGTPNIGAPPEPLFPAASQLGIRWVSYDRSGYGGSSPFPGRDVASAAADVASVADALSIDQFAVMGHSGGGPHCPGMRSAAARTRPRRGQRGRPGALRCRRPRLVCGHGGLRRGVPTRRRRGTRREGEVRGVGRRVRPGVHPSRSGRPVNGPGWPPWSGRPWRPALVKGRAAPVGANRFPRRPA